MNTPASLTLAARPAPFAAVPRRLAAYLADVAVLAAWVLLSQLGLRGLLGSRWPAPVTGGQIEAWTLLTVSQPAWLYFSLSEASRWQATLGKRWLGLHVARRDGARLNLGLALLRTGVKLLPWEMTHLILLLPEPAWSASGAGASRYGLAGVYACLGITLLCAGLTPRRQAVHDLVAGTVVLAGQPA